MPDDWAQVGAEVGSSLVAARLGQAAYVEQLGHPRRPDGRREPRAPAACVDQRDQPRGVRRTPSTTARTSADVDAVDELRRPVPARSRPSSAAAHAPSNASARSIRSTRTTRCSPTAPSTRATRRCPPRRSTSRSRRTVARRPTSAASATSSRLTRPSRRAAVTASAPTRLTTTTQPFYYQYIPATDRPDELRRLAVRQRAPCRPASPARTGRLQWLLVEHGTAGRTRTGTSPGTPTTIRGRIRTASGTARFPDELRASLPPAPVRRQRGHGVHR